MSARAALKFQDTFDAFCLACGFTAAAVAANAGLQGKLLQFFNRAYTRGYTKRLWEDAWSGAEVTPANRLIAFSDIGDARRFEIWDADPRDPDNGAIELRYTTTSAGALLMSDEPTAYVLSMPNNPKFTTDAYNNGTAYTVGQITLATNGNVYKCIQNSTGHEPSASATYWTVVPVLAVLEEFTIAFGRGTYLLENGQPQTGAAERGDAADALDAFAMDEYNRAASSAWSPRN